MSSKPDVFMPLFVGDWMKHTRRLSRADRGTYMDLLIEYWVNGPPPDKPDVLARIAGVTLKEWAKIEPEIRPFFRVEGGVWRNKRLDAELTKATTRKAKAQKGAEAANEKRWGTKKGRSERPASDAQATPKRSLQGRTSHSPSEVTDEGLGGPKPSHKGFGSSGEPSDSHDRNPRVREAARSPDEGGARPAVVEQPAPQPRRFSGADFRALAPTPSASAPPRPESGPSRREKAPSARVVADGA